MTFLNALLAFGATAFSIPLIIHLLNRSKYLTIDWGAMQFLDSSVKVNSRRIQWKQLLLLLIRCLIPVLLALAMARPLLQTWKDTSNSSPMSLAIILDDSMSMQTLSNPSGRIGEQKSRLQQAISETRKILAELPPGSEAAVLLGGQPTERWIEHDPKVLSERLQALNERDESAGQFDLAESARDAADWLEKGSNPRRHLLVASDFQTSQWNGAEQDRARDISNQLTSRTVPITWSFLRIGNPANNLNAKTNRTNLSTLQSDNPTQTIGQEDIGIVAVEAIPSHAVPASKITVTTTLQNFDQEPVQVPVVLMEGLDEIERQSVSIAPNATATVKFLWTPKQTGDAVLKVFADWQDASPQDNAIRKVIRVHDPAKILVIDGDRKREPMQSESDFLRIALTPFSLLRGELGDLFTTQVVDPGGWNEATLKDVDGVVACNIPDFNPDQRKWLRGFVERGGGLLLCTGDKIQIDKYNAWEPVAQGGLRIGTLTQRTNWEGSIKTTSNPVFELSRASQDALASARFLARNSLQVDEPSAISSVEFEDSLPYLISLPIGTGRCFWMLASCDDDDSNLTALPVFLPLIQKVMTSAIRWPSGWKELPPGGTWTESTSDRLWSKASAPKDGSPSISVQIPGENTKQVAWPQSTQTQPSSPGSDPLQGNLKLGSTRLQGIATAMLGEQKIATAISNNTAERKSELSRPVLPPEELSSLAKSASATLVNDSKQWLDQEKSTTNGKELWTWFWLGLLAMFFAEMFLQQSLSPRTSKTSATTTFGAESTSRTRGAA